MKVSRRRFLGATASTFLSLAAARAADPPLPVTGAGAPALAPFDELMRSFVEQHRCPGAALAVARQGVVVYARGFGYADREARQPVAPDALFRIASVSKPLTAVAVLQLAEKGKLKLDDPVLAHLRLKPHLKAGTHLDPRWKQITVRHLLQHTGGWDRDRSGDPIGMPRQIAQALGIRLPVGPASIVRYVMGRPLDFTPGERHAYSNVGYLLLGRLIAAVSGRSYEAVVAEDVLRPLGIRRMQMGRALAEYRVSGEVKYYDPKNRRSPCLYPPRLGAPVPLPYGGENFEGFEAHGGWIGSAIDLVRFAAAFDRPRQCPLLSAASIAAMTARPDGRAGHDADGKPLAAYYGCGWMVRPVGTKGLANLWHTGLIAGTSALLVRRWDGLSWAVLFNTDRNPDGQVLASLIDPLVHQAADRVKSWPRD